MLDHPGPFSEAHGGPIMAQSSTKNGPSWPKMALHDPKWPCITPNGLKILLTGMLHEIMSCWTSLGPFHRPTGAPKCPKIPPKWPFMTQKGPSWPKMALHDPKWCFNEEPSWPKMSLNVGVNDTPLFQKMNIFIEWIIRFFLNEYFFEWIISFLFEWIFLLNE